MVNRVFHVSEFGGGGGEQAMCQSSMRAVPVQHPIGEFVHRFDSLVDETHHFLVMPDLGLGSTTRQFADGTGSSGKPGRGLRIWFERRLETDEIQRLIDIGLSPTSINGTIDEFHRPIASEEFK